MTVSDLVVSVYALAALGGAFLAGLAWTRGQGATRVAGLVFVVAEALVLATYVSWTYDLFHRSFYMLFNGAVALVSTGAWLVVALAVRPKSPRIQGALLVPLGLLGLGAAGWAIVDRGLVWPPFAFLALCLLVAPAVALGPRLAVRGYRPGRDRDFAVWVLLGLCGLLGAVESFSMGRLVPGVPLYGTPPLFSFFLAGTLVLVLGTLHGARPAEVAPSAAATIPWRKFNPPLSPREADLLPGLRRRLTNKELAAELGVSESTVKKRLVSLFRKAGVETRQDLFEALDRVD